MKYDNDGINKNTKAILVNDSQNIKEELWSSQEDLKTIRTIEFYTQFVHKNFITRILIISLLARKNINEINRIKYDKENNNYQYISDSGERITFDLITKHMIGEDKSIKKELSTSNRTKKCHLRAVEVCRSFKNSIVHTGIISLGKNHHLHSVIEFQNKYGDDIILDWTRNLWIDKETYIKLFKFNILSSIQSKDIFNDA